MRFIALARNSTRRLLEIIAALETSNNRARELLADCLGNDAAIRDLAKRVLPAAQVDGDSHGVPSVVDVVGMLVEKIEEKP